ncbi:MAG: 3-methyl-2-oxobutanoate hydroxymethyltransferase [Bdellovibrionales bacterium]
MKIADFKKYKLNQQKISMLTCYDFSFAQIIEKSSIDCILVGDSAAMTMLGEKSTLNISTETLAHFVQAVFRGAPSKFLVADMPFLSFRKGLKPTMDAVEKLMKAGAQAVKIEGADGNLKLIQHITQSGVPVMGHLGLTPQSIHALGGFKVQGRNPEAFDKILKDSIALEEAGCFSIVLECVPSALGKSITQSVSVPTIGIGAGSDTDGQVLVLQDMLGMNPEFKPLFLRHYLNGRDLILKSFEKFHQDVQSHSFPSKKESYE